MGNLLPKENYAMAAVIGLESKKIEEVCMSIQEQGKFLVPANYNCKVQTVISGEEETIEEATEKLKELGARKIIKLKTSGPFHTIKLEEAKKAFEEELKNIQFNIKESNSNQPKVIKNIDGKFYNQTDNINKILADHIINPVRFDKAIELMDKEKVEEYIEIGPGKALTGFIKKENKEANTININNVETLEDYLKSRLKEEEKR